jgi:uncharacterized membrane protein YgcG
LLLCNRLIQFGEPADAHLAGRDNSGSVMTKSVKPPAAASPQGGAASAPPQAATNEAVARLAITYTLIALYVLPLILLFITWSIGGFIENRALTNVSLAINTQYVASARSALGTIAMPFVTAYAVLGAQTGRKIPTETVCLFLVLVGFWVGSMFLKAFVDPIAAQVLQNLTSQDQTLLQAQRDALTESLSAYPRELLVYISLLLGITQNVKR